MTSALGWLWDQLRTGGEYGGRQKGWRSSTLTIDEPPPSSICGRLELCGGRLMLRCAALRHKPEGLGFVSRWSHLIFYWLNLSGRSMSLVSTQPLTNMSARVTFWEEGGKSCRCLRLIALPPSFADGPEILEAWTSWNPNGLSSIV